MIRQGGVCLSKQDLKVFQVVEQYREGKFSRQEAALKLEMSERNLQRKVKAIREQGIEGLIHGNRGNAPHNRKPLEVKDWYVTLYKEKYYDFNFQHAYEFICERHNAPEKVSYSTFRMWMREEGLGKVRKRRSSKARIMRERHANEGMMIQLDGSPHCYNGRIHWTLIHAIDDATSKLLGAGFFPGETTFACMGVLKSIIRAYGVPEFILTDLAGWSARIGKRAHFSQFDRACKELGITIIPTPSAQSKGRVERSFRTAQDRLTAELRLEGIQSMEEANRYLEETFRPHWNERFAVEARQPTTRFRAVPAHIDLDEVFCLKFSRLVNRDHTVSFEGTRYKLTKPPQNLWKHEVVVHKYENGSVKMMYGAEELCIEELKPPKRIWRNAG